MTILTVLWLRHLNPLIFGKEDRHMRDDTRAEQTDLKEFIVDCCENVLLVAKFARNAILAADRKSPLNEHGVGKVPCMPARR